MNLVAQGLTAVLAWLMSIMFLCSIFVASWTTLRMSNWPGLGLVSPFINVSIYNGVVVEDGAFLGPSCVFPNVINPRGFIERKTEFQATRVGRGASVGANATVICGNDLGDYCMIGAGAVVTKDVPAYALMVGMPARRLGWICRCGVRLPAGADLTCTDCGDRYREVEDALIALDPHDGV